MKKGTRRIGFPFQFQHQPDLAASARGHAVADLVGRWRRYPWRCIGRRRSGFRRWRGRNPHLGRRTRWWGGRPDHDGLLHHGRLVDDRCWRLCGLSTTSASQSMRRQRADGRARNHVLHTGLRCLLDNNRRRRRLRGRGCIGLGLHGWWLVGLVIAARYGQRCHRDERKALQIAFQHGDFSLGGAAGRMPLAFCYDLLDTPGFAPGFFLEFSPGIFRRLFPGIFSRVSCRVFRPGFPRHFPLGFPSGRCRAGSAAAGPGFPPAFAPAARGARSCWRCS